MQTVKADEYPSVRSDKTASAGCMDLVFVKPGFFMNSDSQGRRFLYQYCECTCHIREKTYCSVPNQLDLSIYRLHAVAIGRAQSLNVL